MCSAVEINNAVRDLQEYRRMKEQLDAEITAIEDLLKEHMRATGIYELDALTGKVTWLESTSNRFDSSSFKKELPDLYNRYSKPFTTRYFRVLK